MGNKLSQTNHVEHHSCTSFFCYKGFILVAGWQFGGKSKKVKKNRKVEEWM